MNREKSVLQIRLGEGNLDQRMRINIDVPSLVNFVTDKFVSDWIESAVTSRHLNVYNSSRSITHKQADENVIVLKGQNKKRHCKIILFTFIYFLFFTWMM